MEEIKTEDWWIYKNDDKALDDIKDKKPNWRDNTKPTHNADAFIASNKEIIDAVNASIYLRRPLLVTGEPGIGKSSLAKSIAKDLKVGKPLHWQVTSKSVLKDALYSYDALARLYDIQMITKQKENLNEAEEITTDGKMDKPRENSDSIEKYLKLGVLGEAFLSKKRKVILIDEIDKSDIDLPNDLLHIFEEQEFIIDEVKRTNKSLKIDGYTIPKSGKVKCKKDFPIIIMTSNGDREFPSAFLRRCISVKIELPKDKIGFLKKMVINHFKEDGKDFKIEDGDDIDKIIKYFVDLKEKGLRTNDQLLNAVYMVLNIGDMTFDKFKEDFENTISKEIG